jgi:signal peptidase II
MRHPPRLSIGLALAAVLAGAIGNLIDRLWLQSVRDFIDVHIGSYTWLTFNVADIFITVGAIALALLVMFEPSADQPPPAVSAE